MGFWNTAARGLGECFSHFVCFPCELYETVSLVRREVQVPAATRRRKRPNSDANENILLKPRNNSAPNQSGRPEGILKRTNAIHAPPLDQLEATNNKQQISHGEVQEGDASSHGAFSFVPSIERIARNNGNLQQVQEEITRNNSSPQTPHGGEVQEEITRNSGSLQTFHEGDIQKGDASSHKAFSFVPSAERIARNNGNSQQVRKEITQNSGSPQTLRGGKFQEASSRKPFSPTPSAALFAQCGGNSEAGIEGSSIESVRKSFSTDSKPLGIEQASAEEHPAEQIAEEHHKTSFLRVFSKPSKPKVKTNPLTANNLVEYNDPQSMLERSLGGRKLPSCRFLGEQAPHRKIERWVESYSSDDPAEKDKQIINMANIRDLIERIKRVENMRKINKAVKSKNTPSNHTAQNDNTAEDNNKAENNNLPETNTADNDNTAKNNRNKAEATLVVEATNPPQAKTEEDPNGSLSLEYEWLRESVA